MTFAWQQAEEDETQPVGVEISSSRASAGLAASDASGAAYGVSPFAKSVTASASRTLKTRQP